MNNIEYDLERELGDELKVNVVLKDLVSIGVGGVADFFYEAKSIENLVHAVSYAYKLKIPYFVIGSGTNVIPSDAGFPGLVIKNSSSNIVFANDSSQVIADSGVKIASLVNLAASRGLGGLEFLFGVPGTIGGAVYGNAGAFGYEISDFVKSLTLLLPKDEEMIMAKHSSAWMNFSYRKSNLKTDNFSKDSKPIILTVRLQLVQRRRDEIVNMIQENLKLKKGKQPLSERSSGSFFKNIGLESELSAGYLLDQSGVKKLKVGGAAFSKKHANFLVNSKNATALDIRMLADKAKKAVKEKFGKDLEEEIEYIGRW